MRAESKNLLAVIGPTAAAKTRLAARLAHRYAGEILSADSRQVYRGLDIGSGKDLHEYRVDGVDIPYHLIDIASLDEEFSVFDYQRRFFEVFTDVQARGALPILAGGTGLYIDAVLRGYRMVEVPEDPALRAELAKLADDELAQRLRALKPDLHNTTDLTDRDRTIRAIEIAEHARRSDPEPLPPVNPLILGVSFPRPELRERIRQRLKARMDEGLVEEVERLLAGGASPEKLHTLGLEYRYVNDFLQGRIRNRNDLLQKLASAIGQFAKRQETWFRRMERLGHEIHWLERGNFQDACRLADAHWAPARAS
jgi:tRNA dimethylallyltransferase